MAPIVRTKLTHGIYDTFNHQRGFEYPDNEGQLTDLLIAADSALTRSQGYFFTSFEKTFLVGFMNERSGGRTNNPGVARAYFDVFGMPVEDVNDIPLPNLIDTLRQLKVKEFTDTPVEETEIEMDGREPTCPPGSDIDFDLLAEFWEQYRRPSVQCRATVAEVEYVARYVDGVVGGVSFVSALREDSDHFDVAGGKELEKKFEPDQLASTIHQMYENGTLTLQDLPTYRDQLNSMWRTKTETVRTLENIEDGVDEVIDNHALRMKMAFEDYPAIAAELIEDASAGTLEPSQQNDDNSLTGKLIGGGGSSTSEDLAIFDSANCENVTQEEIQAIDERLENERQQMWEEVREDILEDLEEELLDRLSTETKLVAREVVKRIDETRGSEVYEKLND